MIEFGSTLRAAREARGYTVAQISELTRIAPTTISELESEDFSHIAAPIYGRGFVKLYCEAVGLDPKPLIAEFMDIYNGTRDTCIRERAVEPPPAPEQEAPAAPAPAAPAVPEEPEEPEPQPEPTPPPAADLFQPRPREVPPVAEPIPAAAPVAPATPPPASAAAPQPAPLSRYAAPVRQSNALPLNPSLWRIGVIAAIAILLLWGLVCGVRSLYRATSSAPASDAPQAEAPVAPVAPKAAEPKKPAAPATSPSAAPVKRQPQKIPSLYVD